MRTTDGFRNLAYTACLALAACGGGAAPQPAQAAPPPAELRIGDLRIIASAVNTTALPASVTKTYGIARGEQTWLLLVSVRRGPEGAEKAVSATVEARARDLQGRTIDIPMRDGSKLEFNGADYINHFALPNLYFHVATAYNILRHNGVAIGKRDFIGGV